MDTAQSSLALAEATLEQRREDITRTNRALSELLGDVALSQIDLSYNLPLVYKPVSAYPAQILGRRPDIAAAITRVVASRHRAAAAKKALLPSFSLSANLDGSGTSLAKMLKADPTWALISSLTAPLFDGGRRASQADASEIASERALLAYQEMLLQAVIEIENTLGAEMVLSAQIVDLTNARNHAQRSRENFEQRYSRGLVDVLDLLIIQRAAFDAELRLLEAQLQMARNRVNLGLALGLDVAA